MLAAIRYSRRSGARSDPVLAAEYQAVYAERVEQLAAPAELARCLGSAASEPIRQAPEAAFDRAQA